jgi:hypothetical protein
MTFEGIERRAPPCPIWGEPVVDLPERLGAHLVEASLSITANLDEAEVAEHSEMLGHRRLADVEGAHQLADRPLPGPEKVEYPTPVGLGKCLECGGHGSEYAVTAI